MQLTRDMIVIETFGELHNI